MLQSIRYGRSEMSRAFCALGCKMRMLFRQLVGTQRLEREIRSVVDQVVDKMVTKGPHVPIDLHQHVLKAVYNMVMVLAFGKRCSSVIPYADILLQPASL